MPHAASPSCPPPPPPLLLLVTIALAGALAVADIAEGPVLGGGREQRPQEFTGHDGRRQQEYGLEGELLELKSYAVTKQPPVLQSSVRSASEDPYYSLTLTTHKDERPELNTEVGFSIADVQRPSNTENTRKDDQRNPLPVNSEIITSNVTSSITAEIGGEIHKNSAKPIAQAGSESLNNRDYAGEVETMKEQQECLERSEKCSTRRTTGENGRHNNSRGVGDIQKRAMVSHNKGEDIAVPGGELLQKSAEKRPAGRSYEVTDGSQELQGSNDDDSEYNEEDAEDTTASEEQDDEVEDYDDDDYDGEGNDKGSDGEPEVANYGTPEDNDVEDMADTAEFNKVAEDLLELMVHIAENPTRWQKLASHLKEEGGQYDVYHSLKKRRNLERLKHRHQQREFDWSQVQDNKEATSGRQASESKQRKNRLRQLMKAGVLPEDDHILRPLGKSRPGKGGSGTRSRGRAKARHRPRGRGRLSRRKLSRKGLASNATATTAAPAAVEVTTRKSVHPLDDQEFLEYARQVASRYQTALTDDVIREKVMQGWKGTPAPEKVTPPSSGKKLSQYDPEAVISRYKYVLTDEAIREKILQGPRGRYNDTRERHRPPLPPPRNMSVPPYREPFYPEKGNWTGRNNSSRTGHSGVSAEQVTPGRNGSRLYNVSTRGGGVRYEEGGRSSSPGAYHTGGLGRYSDGNEMWLNFVDRALNGSRADKEWERQQGVQPKQQVAAGGGGDQDNQLPAGPQPPPQPTPRRLPHFTYHRVTSQPAPRSRHRDAYVAVSVAAPPEGHRQRHKGVVAAAAAGAAGAEVGNARSADSAPTPTAAANLPATTPAPIDLEAIRRVLHMRDPLEEELVDAAVAARHLSRWPAAGGGGGGDQGPRRDFWQHLGDVLKLQEETKTLAALEAKLHSAREADQDRVRKILAGDVTAEDGSVKGM